MSFRQSQPSRLRTRLFAVLLIAAIALMSVHLVATYRADQAARAAAGSVKLASVTFPLHASDDLRGMNVFLEVSNPTAEPVEVTLSQVNARGGEQELGLLNWVGEPILTVPAQGDQRVQGRRNVWQNVFSAWQEQGAVDIVVAGTIEASADVFWVTAEHQQSFELSTDVHFF